MNNWNFKKGIVELDDKKLGNIESFEFSIDNDIQQGVLIRTSNMTFNIILKLPLIDRIKRFFGFKTNFEKLLGDLK